jgi:hypothetical protein
MELEARNSLWDPNHDKALRRLDAVSRDLFGVADEDLDAHFHESVEDNEEAAEHLARGLRWDIADKSGETLECFHWLAATLIYASRGFGGHLPDPDRTASVVTWEDEIQRAADAFRTSRRRGA